LTFFICFQLPLLSSRAVQLGSLYVRGLSHLLGANTASGCPLPNAALMPWHSFDGRLFHSKYLLAHRGIEKTELLDSDVSGDRKTVKGTCDWDRVNILGKKKDFHYINEQHSFRHSLCVYSCAALT